MAGCRPASVTDAESKGNVRWLSDNGSPDAVAALGRLADKDPKALSALQARAGFDASTYVAAWAATVREASWGPGILRSGLADASRAEVATEAMDRHDAHLSLFADDLENALARLSASPTNTGIASALASCGGLAHAAIERRLADGATRVPMCRGIASPDTSPDARATLLEVPAGSRDATACVDAVVKLAQLDESTLTWLATNGEPGILGAASKSEGLACPRLHTIWARALEQRKADVYPALVVPLSNAIKRCTVELDGVLADAILRLPQTRPVVINAIDPYDTYGKSLKTTCAALAKVANGGDASILRERARDTRDHGCLSQ